MKVACVEAEEISRLTAELERAVVAANREALKRRAAEKRLAALDTRLIALKTNGRRTPRSMSRTPSPHSNTRSNDGSAMDAGWANRKPWSPGGGASCPSSAWAGSGSRDPNRGRETKSLPPPKRGATGSTVASRGRRLSRDSTGSRREGGRVCGKGRSSSSRRGSRGSEKEHWRPPGCSPPPSPVGTGAGRGRGRVSGGAAASPLCYRPRGRGRSGEVGPAPCLKDSSLGFSNESVKTNGRCGGGGGGGSGRGRESVSRFDMDRLGTGERGASVALTRNGDGASGARVLSTPADEIWSGGMSEAGAIAAAIRGVDFSETVARELRLAVATTAAAPVHAAASPPASRETTSSARRGSAEDMTRKHIPVDGAGGRGGKAAPLSDCGDERRTGAPESWEKGEASGRHRRGGSEYTSGGFNLHGRISGGSPGDRGRALKSREVVELESDVQHIFQFFEARDRVGKVGRDRSGLAEGGGGGGGESAEAEE
ncbi:unnamed protein product, partial [Laminaria digitata]